MEDLNGPLGIVDNNAGGLQADPAWTSDVFME